MNKQMKTAIHSVLVAILGVFFMSITLAAIADDYHAFELRYQDGKKLSDLDSDNLMGFGFEFHRELNWLFYQGSIHHQQGGDTDQFGFQAEVGIHIDNEWKVSYAYFGETLHEYWLQQSDTSKGSDLVIKDTDWRELHRMKLVYDFGNLELGYSASFVEHGGDKYQHGIHAAYIHPITNSWSAFIKSDYYLDYKYDQQWLDAPLFMFGFRYKTN